MGKKGCQVSSSINKGVNESKKHGILELQGNPKSILGLQVSGEAVSFCGKAGAGG